MPPKAAKVGRTHRLQSVVVESKRYGMQNSKPARASARDNADSAPRMFGARPSALSAVKMLFERGFKVHSLCVAQK